MYLEKFCVLIFVVQCVISATDFCIKQSPCKCEMNLGQVIDLAPAGLNEYPRFYQVPVPDENSTGLYTYNPCFPFASSDKHTKVNKSNKACKEAAACMRTPGGNEGEFPEEHAIGLQSTAKFGNNTKYGFHVNYSVPDALQNLTVRLICDNSSTHRLYIDIFETPENPNVVMNLTSKCACPNGCLSDPPPEPSGLSTGSILLIMFFTMLIAYFLVGVVWNFCNGAHGVELIPNLEFWNDMPKLIIEGVLFTCSCFGRKSSYGEV